MRKAHGILGLIGIGVLAAGCVPQTKFDATARELARVQAEQRDLRAARAEDERGRKQLEDQIAMLQSALEAAGKALYDGNAYVSMQDERLRDLRAQLDEATALEARLRGELEKLGKNADALLSEKGALAQELADARVRLEELRRAQDAAEARARLYKDLRKRLEKMVDAGDLRVSVRDGRIILALPTDVLFDSGKTDLKPQGRAAIGQLTRVLGSLKDRKFQVAGHTDDRPIRTGRFPSNWELSTARAVEVVHLMVEGGLPADHVSAAGYGEFDPIASNDAVGRAKNRRIEITLQPNVDELLSLPDGG